MLDNRNEPELQIEIQLSPKDLARLTYIAEKLRRAEI